MSHKKFLEFNGKSIYFLSVDGTYWVAVKPICDALGLEWTRQFKNLQTDDILSGALAKQPMHDASGRLQEMVCLPEKWVYGWLFSIRSESADLREYKRTCYDLLYDHFHGAITERMGVLREKSKLDQEIEQLQKQLKETEVYQKLDNAKKQRSLEGKQLTNLDARAIQQMGIFDEKPE